MAEPSKMSERVARQIFLRSMSADPAPSGGDAMDALAHQMEDVFFEADQVIYRRGEAPEFIYFVVRGTVHLIGDGEPWKFSERAVIGVIDANMDRPYTRTAVAITDVHALRLPAEEYFDMLEDSFERMRTTFENVCRGLGDFIATLGPTGGFSAPPDAAYVSEEAVRPLNPVERIQIIRSVEAFRQATIESLARLARVAEEVFLRAGPVAMLPGGKSHLLLVVGRGVLELERAEPPLIAKFGPKSLVGGLSATLDRRPFVRLTALTPAVLLVLRLEDILDVMEDHFDLSRSIMRHLTSERERLMGFRDGIVPRAPTS